MEESNAFDIEKIIKEHNRIYIDLSDCDVNDLKIITQKNTPFITKYESSFCVLNLESRRPDPSVASALDMLVSRKFFTLLAGKDYLDIFSALKNEDKREIYLAIKVGQRRRAIIESAKQAKLFVHFCQINDDGSIGDIVYRKNNFKINKDETDSSDNTIKAAYQIKNKPEIIDIQPIRVADVLIVGREVFDSAGNSYTLQEKVLANNGASTYKTNSETIWVKLYDQTHLNTFIERKILRMLKNRLEYQGLCWPMDVALDSHKTFRGYFVKAAHGEPLHLSVMKKAGLEKYFPRWNKVNLCTLAITILDKIDFLHKNGILMGCINPAAIRVADENTVYFTDTDNYQVEGFPSFVYNISFTPPELLDKKIYLTSRESENFAIAELAFMIMMTGKTPYAVGVSGNPEDEIKKMAFPYSNKTIHGNHALPSMWRFMWSHLTPQMKKTFYETFQRNGSFNSLANRRKLDFWISAIKEFRSELQNPFDKESLKIYPQTFKRSKNEIFYKCSFCGVEHPRFYFSDQYFDDYHICNDCIEKKSDVGFTCVDCGKTYYYTNRTALFHKQMKKKDAEWKDQKHCRDCKNKTMVCSQCGKEFPFYRLKHGICLDCRSENENKVYRVVKCKTCGRSFELTYRDKEFFERKEMNLPKNCPDCRGKKKRNGGGGSSSKGSFWDKLFGK